MSDIDERAEEDPGQVFYNPRFAAIPEWVLYHEALSDKAVRVFGALARIAGSSHKAFPGRKHIAVLLRCHPATISKALAELAAAEAVIIEHRFRSDRSQTSNNYHLQYDPPARNRVEATTPNGAAPLRQIAQGINESPFNDKEPSMSETPEAASLTLDLPSETENPEIAAVCSQLAIWIGKFHGHEPKVGDDWYRVIRLLTERGPTNWAKPAPVPIDKVRRMVNHIFTRFNEPEGSGGFCWAEVIQSPVKLRKHWDQLVTKANGQWRRQRSSENDDLAPGYAHCNVLG